MSGPTPSQTPILSQSFIFSGRGYVDPNVPSFRPPGLIVLGVLYAIISAVSCILMWRFRGHYHVRITSIAFSYLTAFGGLLVTIAEVYVRSSTYAVCFAYVIVANTGLAITFGGLFAKITRVVAAILAKKKNESRRKKNGASRDKVGVRSGNDTISLNTDMFETSMSNHPIGKDGTSYGGAGSGGASGNAKWLSPVTSNTDTQKQAKEERRKAKESDLLSSSRKKSLDPEFFDWRMGQNVILIVVLSVALTVAICYIAKGFDNPDINQCEVSSTVLPRYILDSIILLFLTAGLGSFFFIMRDSRETLGVRDDMKLLQLVLLPIFGLTAIWLHILDRYANSAFAKYLPGAVPMIFSMIALQCIVVAKPVLYSYLELKTLSSASSTSKDDFQKILNSPGLFRLFLDFCLSEGHPENIVFVREMKDVFFKVRGFDDSVVVPDHLRPTYKAIFHRYINRGSRLELPLPPSILQQIKEEFDNRDTLTIGCFNRAHSHILSSLLNNSYPRFIEAFKSGKISPNKATR